MIFYTDYPIVEFGDVEGKWAPLRRCNMLSYDGDKYCKVVVIDNDFHGGIVHKEIKAGYIYHQISKEVLEEYAK